MIAYNQALTSHHNASVADEKKQKQSRSEDVCLGTINNVLGALIFLNQYIILTLKKCLYICPLRKAILINWL